MKSIFLLSFLHGILASPINSAASEAKDVWVILKDAVQVRYTASAATAATAATYQQLLNIPVDRVHKFAGYSLLASTLNNGQIQMMQDDPRVRISKPSQISHSDGNRFTMSLVPTKA